MLRNAIINAIHDLGFSHCRLVTNNILHRSVKVFTFSAFLQKCHFLLKIGKIMIPLFLRDKLIFYTIPILCTFCRLRQENYTILILVIPVQPGKHFQKVSSGCVLFCEERCRIQEHAVEQKYTNNWNVPMQK